MKGENITLSFGMNMIYDSASFNINKYDKVGIVGVNGAGKTTLFNILLGNINLDSGKIRLDKINKIGYLPQELEISDKELNVLDYLLSARPIKELEEKLEKLYIDLSQSSEIVYNKILKQIEKTELQLEYYDRYNAENTLFEIIENMNISSNLLDMKLKDLSGGQKSKITFAHLIYSAPEILLLDEPTNHLDPVTQQIIGENFKNYEGTIIVVSHNPSFVESINVDRMLILPSGKITNYDKSKLEKYYELNKNN